MASVHEHPRGRRSREEKPVPNDSDVESIAREYFTALSEGDLDKICSFYTRDITYEDIFARRVCHGLIATRHYHAATTLPLGARWEVGKIVATDEGFAASGIVESDNATAIAGPVPPHRSSRAAAAAIGSVWNGKIGHYREYRSGSSNLRQSNPGNWSVV
jgi:ketosteroid isomerase-like protein